MLHHPNNYLSSSQFTLWKTSPEEYFQRYLFGKKITSKYMEFGKFVHGELEKKKSDNETIELIRPLIPECELNEQEVKAKVGDVPLLGYIDKLDPHQKILIDIKTGKNYTQKKADDLEQLTFYHILIEKKFGWTPIETYIYWLETADDNGLYLTGRVEAFKTTRSEAQVEFMKEEIQDVWQEIGEACYERINSEIMGTYKSKKVIRL